MPKTPFSAKDRTLVLGHRGASAEAPENTLAAFRLALDLGADGVELDVWRCGTGEVVVIHDETTRRTAGGTLVVPEAPLTALRDLDAGAWKGERFIGERIPLLAEVLEALPFAWINVELKGPSGDSRLARAAAAVIRSAKAEARVLVSSFDFGLLAGFSAAAPEVPCGLLFDARHPWRFRVALAARRLKVRALHPEAKLCTAARLGCWRARGLWVNAWTVDDPAEVARLAALGATALITNTPGEVVRQLAFGRPRLV